MIPKSKIRLSRTLRAQTTPYPNAKKLLKRGLLVLLVGLIIGIYGVAHNAKNPDLNVANDKEKQILGEQQNANQFQTYRTREGDTLFNIANRYNVGWQEMARLNSLEEPFTLKIGQELKLPR